MMTDKEFDLLMIMTENLKLMGERLIVIEDATLALKARVDALEKDEICATF